jgi:argininosuccinate lyase
MMKALPLAYNKDMQEDKPAIFDSVDTAKLCISVFNGMLETMVFNKGQMASSAGLGYANATDLADYLAAKGVPFREAHEITGKIVSHCIAAGVPLEGLGLEAFRSFSNLIGEDIYGYISLKACVERRKTPGGPSSSSVKSHLETARDFLSTFKIPKNG